MSYGVKGAPFRFKGAINVENCSTAESVMLNAGLDWEVKKCKLVAEMPMFVPDNFEGEGFSHGNSLYRECPNAYATYRTDYNIPLGIVKDRYTPVQNKDAFSFFNNAIGKNKAIWQTAGFFGRGERIFVSAKLPNTILVDGDPVENYIVFTTSHDGTSGIKILFTPIRVICENTLNAAIQMSDKFVSFRHTKSVHSKIDIAAELLGICNTKCSDMAMYFNTMKKIKCDDNKAQQIFSDVILTEDEHLNIVNTGHTIGQIINRNWQAIEDSKISMKKVNILCEINNYYFSGVGQKEILGTGWGVYNAITGYYSNVDNSEGIKRMDSLLYGDKSRKIELAGNLILNEAV